MAENILEKIELEEEVNNIDLKKYRVVFKSFDFFNGYYSYIELLSDSERAFLRISFEEDDGSGNTYNVSELYKVDYDKSISFFHRNSHGN